MDETEMKFKLYVIILSFITLILFISLISATYYDIKKLEYHGMQQDLTHCYDFQKTKDCDDNMFFWSNGEVKCFNENHEIRNIGTWNRNIGDN